MGASVDLSTFGNVNVLFIALCFTVAAIVGKQACALAVVEKGVNRLAIGVGMIPRGEVGLIFAAVGSKLMIDGVKVVTPSTYSAMIIMIIITTMITPPLLKIALLKSDKNNETKKQ